jgi:hypothetical protein
MLVLSCTRAKPPKDDDVQEPEELTEYRSVTPITLETLLDEMVDYAQDPFLSSPSYVSAQRSSTDPRSIAPDQPFWFANNDGTGYVRMENSSKVLFDEEGPGVITRIWTAGRIPDKTFNFYFDGETKPRIILVGNNLTTLSWDPQSPLAFAHTYFTTKGGTNLYYPIPYAKSLKIVANLPDYYGVAYHIAFRTYEKGTEMESFSAGNAKALKQKAQDICDKLDNPESWSQGTICQTIETLNAGKTLILDLPRGDAAVRNLKIQVGGFNDASRSELFRKLIVKMTFDKHETVWAPLDMFSGGGIGAYDVDNYYMTSDGKGSCEWRYVMPYRDSAKLEIINITNDMNPTIRVTANVDEDFTWHTNSLYFFASFHQQRGLHTNNDYDSNNNTEWTSQEIIGKGIMKGDVLSLYNDKETWYGEGDEKIYIDGQTYPNWFGTGTEDYYNTSFAPVKEFQNAFGGAVRCDSESSFGYNTWLRTRNLDGATFNRSLKFNWELLGWSPASVIYSSVVYWYGTGESEAIETSSESELKFILP